MVGYSELERNGSLSVWSFVSCEQRDYNGTRGSADWYTLHEPQLSHSILSSTLPLNSPLIMGYRAGYLGFRTLSSFVDKEDTLSSLILMFGLQYYHSFSPFKMGFRVGYWEFMTLSSLPTYMIFFVNQRITLSLSILSSTLQLISPLIIGFRARYLGIYMNL